MNSPRLPIRIKLLLLVLLAALPAFGVVLHSGLTEQRHALVMAKANAIHITRDLARHQEQITASTRQFLITLSLLPQVRALDSAECSALFARLLTENPIYSNIVLADAQGVILASAQPWKPGFSVGDTPQFRNAMTSGNFATGGYYLSRTTGLLALPFTIPVRNARGGIIGVLGIGLRLSHFEGSIKGLDLPEGSTVFMADRNGVRLFNSHFPSPRPDLFPLGQPVTLKQRGLLESAAPGEPFFAMGLDGQRRLFVVQKLSLAEGQEPFLHVGVSIPERMILAQERQALLHNLSLLGLAAFLVATLAWGLGKRAFIQRIERLAEVAGRFAQGDFAARTGLSPVNDELGELASATDRIGQELAQREAEREATLKRLSLTQYAVDHAGDEIYWTDKDGRIIYANERACQSLGYSREELLGMTVFDVDSVFEPAQWPALLERLTGGPTSIETRHRNRSGAEVPKEFSLSLMDLGGAQLIFGSARDISERKRHEAVLRSLVDESAALTGQAFFESLAELMVRLLGADAAFAAEYTDQQPATVRTLAFRIHGEMRPAFDYPLAGAPCADIPDSGHLLIPHGLPDRYPDAALLRRMGIQAYLGVVLLDSKGARIGHLALLSTRPLGHDPLRLSTMRLFALRASAELERMRTERAVLASLREKEVLLKEVHHRVKNNLQIVCSLLALQGGNVTDPVALQLLDESRARILSMALVHEDLYQSDNLALVDIQRYMSRLAERVASSLADSSRASFDLDIAPLSLTIDQAIPLGLLTNELLTNALKHAFPDGATGTVRLSLRQSDGQAVFRFSDNGVGLPPDFQPGGRGTLGMQLIWTLAAQLHGQMQAENLGGAVFTLRFPLVNPTLRAAPGS